jgi:hypothetical protein
MKNQTLTKRAAAIRPDYSPLPAAPNPQAEAARAALKEYGRQLLNNPPQVVEPQAEQVPPPLYPLDRPAVEWVTFADDTGCALWLDDPAGVGVVVPGGNVAGEGER